MLLKILLYCGVSFQTFAASDPEAVELLRHIDQLYRADSSEAALNMKIDTPDWSRELKLQAWSEGKKKTFIRILAPKKDAGVATLRMDREMWNFFPKIDKVIKVPPSMMMGAWMGSDFTNDDLVREISMVDDYDSAIEKKGATTLLHLVPRKGVPVVWSRVDVAVDANTRLPLEETFFDEKNQVIRVMRFKEVRNFNGRSVPSVMMLESAKKPGHRTTVTYEKLRFNVALPSGTFSLRNLKK